MEIRPLAGHMDADSADGAVGFYNVRLALNVSVDSERTRCRLGGWRKFGDTSPSGFNNQDFHDQLLDCLWYRQSFEETVLVGGDGTGLSYPYFQPDYLIGADTLDFCGYGPDFHGEYPQTPTPGIRFFCQSFIGYPYVQTPSQAGAGISFSSYATGTDNFIEPPHSTLITWDRDDIQEGLDWLDALEAAQGPSQEIDDARDFLNNIYGPATDRSQHAAHGEGDGVQDNRGCEKPPRLGHALEQRVAPVAGRRGVGCVDSVSRVEYVVEYVGRRVRHSQAGQGGQVQRPRKGGRARADEAPDGHRHERHGEGPWPG